MTHKDNYDDSLMFPKITILRPNKSAASSCSPIRCVFVYVSVCVGLCLRACLRAACVCQRACVCACVCVCARA
jgi:hypothetical protein